MTERTDSASRVLLVSAAVAFGCSLLVTAAVTYFRPLQAAFTTLDRDRAVLVASGLSEYGEEHGAREVTKRLSQLEKRVVDLRTDAFTTAVDPESFDFEAAAQSESGSIALTDVQDLAGIGRLPNLVLVYVRTGEEGIEQIVLPVYGEGMWSTIKAFIALDGDATTVNALVVDEHGETPGIGDRIEDPAWLAGWAGLKPFESEIRLGASDAGTSAGKVDAITGATVTAKSVVTLVRFWLGPDGYGPFLENLRADNE